MCPSHCSPRFAASLGFAAVLSFLRVGADTCTAPPSGWVAWWPAEGNGEEHRSFTPATADGSTFGAGRVGQGFGFAGATAGLSLGAAPWLQREDFTVEAWVQRRDATVAANGAGDRGWILSFGAGGWGVGVLDDGRLVLSRVGEADVASASPVVTDTAFHHVAFTRSEGTVTFYADGTAVGEAELDQRFRFETPAAIGRRGDDKSGSFAGTIDELAVFDRALSAAEVAALFGAGSAGKCIPAADVPNDVAAGTERWIRGGAATGNQVVVSDGFSVFGRLRLESTEGGYVSGVDVGDGFLANEAGGEVAVNVGSGGPRYLRGNFLNRGTMNVRQGLTVDRSLAILRNEGTIDLSTGGLLLRGAGVQLELAGGAVTGAQSIDAVSAQIRFLDGRLEVPVTAVNSTVEFGPGNTNAAAIVLAGSGSRLRGDIAPAQSVTVEGSARVGNTVARAPLGFANAGTLRLQSRDGGYQASLALDSGRLTNRTGGLLVSGVGAGGPRTLTAALVNEGTFRTDQPLTLVWPGGVHANRGTVGISAGQTLYLSGNGQTFRQEAGTFRIDGYLDATGIRFEYLGGRIEGPLELHQGTLVLSSAATEPASFVLAGSSSKFEGDIQPGQSVWIRGDSRDSHTTVTVGAFANRGTVLLRSRDGGYRSSLTVTGGSLSNEVGGQLIVAPGAGGPRELQAELANRGAFLVQQPVSLNAAGANHLNRGTIDIAPGQTLGIAGQGQTLRQEAGTINIGGGMDLSSLNLQFLGGEIVGTPYLDNVNLTLGNGATGPAKLPMTRTGSQVRGSIKPGQEIWVRGDSRGSHTTLVFPDGMTNHGVLRLRSADGGYVSSVSVPSGGMFNAADGQLLVEAGAAGPRTLAGPLVNEGWVSINWPTTLVFAGATHVNRGEFDVMPGMALGISGQGQTFRQEAGRIRFDGGADLTGIVFDWVGGTVVGSPLLDGVDLRVAPGVTQPFSLSLIRSSSQFAGELKTGQTLWVRGDSRGYHMMLGLPDDFSDAGLLLLESRDGGYQSGVRVGSGNLTVQPGGILRAGVGTGGPRPIDAALLNRGRVEANLSVTLGRAGLKHRNEGEFVVAPGAALGFSGTGQTFEQAGGFLQIDGSATLRDQIFRYLGGLVKGQIYMANDTLEFGPGAGPSGTFLTGGSGMRLSGRIPSGATVIVQGSSDAYHTLEVAPNGLGIDGVLQLVSRDGGYNSALRVDGAPLAIGAGGLLQFSAGSSGPRSVTGEVRSAGKIRADFSATLGQAATPVLSTGEIAVAAGVTLTLPGGVQAGGGRIEGAGASRARAPSWGRCWATRRWHPGRGWRCCRSTAISSRGRRAPWNSRSAAKPPARDTTSWC